jgi:hypothetical protein
LEQIMMDRRWSPPTPNLSGWSPPTFTKAEEPLDADAWVRAIEAKFFAFVLPCSEESKASFVTLQLRRKALMW